MLDLLSRGAVDESTPVSKRFRSVQRELRAIGHHYEGLRFIDFSGEQTAFPRGHRQITTALDNLDRQPPEAFRVFRNMNDEVAVKELRKLPFYYLV